jgi:LuxR family transcriptional regulator, maltose regulon positive regulatory protein
MRPKTARVSAAAVYAADLPAGGIELDSAAWFKWLEQDATRSFSYPLFDARCGYIIGFMTVRKEARRRGRWYWSVYRRQDGRVVKHYLGRSSSVTVARLEQVVSSLLHQRAPPKRHSTARADGRQRPMWQCM